MALNKGYLTAKTDKASDEVFTPAYAVKPLLTYLANLYIEKLDRYYGETPDFTIWCPFDDENSEYVKIFRKAGYKVIATHIDAGQNFFTYEPEEYYDIIISNPPFSLKDQVLKRLYELNKPFAILLPLPSLQGQARFPYLKDCQVIIFDKRINFYKDSAKTIMEKGVAFASIYVCKDFLPRDLIFKELKVDE